MKIQIVYNNEDVLTKDDFAPTRLEALPEIEDASCTAIRLGQVLDFAAEREIILDTIVSKLRYNGVVFVEGLDLISLGHSIVYGQFTDTEASELLYNNKRASISDMAATTNILTQRGLHIKTKNLDGSYFFIEAKRLRPDEN